jgi:hypothetical protein
MAGAIPYFFFFLLRRLNRLHCGRSEHHPGLVGTLVDVAPCGGDQLRAGASERNEPGGSAPSFAYRSLLRPPCSASPAAIGEVVLSFSRWILFRHHARGPGVLPSAQVAGVSPEHSSSGALRCRRPSAGSTSLRRVCERLGQGHKILGERTIWPDESLFVGDAARYRDRGHGITRAQC